MRVESRSTRLPKLGRGKRKIRRTKSNSPDKVSLTGGKDSWFTPVVKLAKSVAIASAVGAGLGVVGALGGLPAVALATAGGALAGFSVKPALFRADNALGTAASFAGAAALGMAGPVGIAAAGLLGGALCLNSAICTQQTEFG